MLVFARWITPALDAVVQRSHASNTRKHRWSAERGDQDRRFDGCLSFGGHIAQLSAEQLQPALGSGAEEM